MPGTFRKNPARGMGLARGEIQVSRVTLNLRKDSAFSLKNSLDGHFERDLSLRGFVFCLIEPAYRSLIDPICAFSQRKEKRRGTRLLRIGNRDREAHNSNRTEGDAKEKESEGRMGGPAPAHWRVQLALPFCSFTLFGWVNHLVIPDSPDDRLNQAIHSFWLIPLHYVKSEFGLACRALA